MRKRGGREGRPDLPEGVVRAALISVPLRGSRSPRAIVRAIRSLFGERREGCPGTLPSASACLSVDLVGDDGKAGPLQGFEVAADGPVMLRRIGRQGLGHLIERRAVSESGKAPGGGCVAESTGRREASKPSSVSGDPDGRVSRPPGLDAKKLRQPSSALR